MHPCEQRNVVKVPQKRWITTTSLVVGVFGLAMGVLWLLQDRYTLFLFFGPIVFAAGIVSLFRPYLAFDPNRDALYLYAPFGYRYGTFGAPSGERLRVRGHQIVRIDAEGTVRAVPTGVGRDDDVERVRHLIEGRQRHEPGGAA